jgi:hypothetical protein
MHMCPQDSKLQRNQYFRIRVLHQLMHAHQLGLRLRRTLTRGDMETPNPTQQPEPRMSELVGHKLIAVHALEV